MCVLIRLQAVALLAGMNAYERQREERIASNRARLAALDLPGMASNFADAHLSKPKPKKPSKPRGLAAKRQKKVRHPCLPNNPASSACPINDSILRRYHYHSMHLSSPKKP